MRRASNAFTLVELLIIVLVISGLLVMLMPSYPSDHPKSLTATCMSNVRQVGLMFQLWADDHGSQFPMEVSVTNGGSMERIDAGSPAAHFQAVTNYLRNLSVWACPTDESRKQATAAGTGQFSDAVISYFLNLDATPRTTNAFFLLSGDRHLQVAGQAVKPGLVRLSTNDGVSWTRELHKKARGGNLLFVDGHAEFTRTTDLPAKLRAHGRAETRLAIP